MGISIVAPELGRLEGKRAELGAMLKAKTEAAIEAEKRGAFVLAAKLENEAETILDDLLATL